MANYTPQSGDVLIPGAQAATELLSSVGGFIAGCGEAGLAVIGHILNGEPVSASEVTAIIKDAISHGASPAGGTSTPAELQATANDLGFSLTSVNWQTALAQDAGVVPIELGLSHASALGGADAGIQGHYIVVVGKTASGNFIVSDPNTQASKSGGFVTYTAGQIASSQPFWAGIPGTATGSASGAANAAPGIANTLSGIPAAITQGVNQIDSSIASGARIALWLVLGLAIVGMGAWLLIPEQTKQQVGGAVKGAGEKAAEVAALAAG